MGLLSSPAWTRKEGKNPKGGLNAKGRASYNKGRTKTGKKRNLKPPAPNPKTKKDKSRRKSFCARMRGMKKKPMKHGGKVHRNKKGHGGMMIVKMTKDKKKKK